MKAMISSILLALFVACATAQDSLKEEMAEPVDFCETKCKERQDDCLGDNDWTWCDESFVRCMDYCD